MFMFCVLMHPVELISFGLNGGWRTILLLLSIILTMVIWVVEFPREGYKIKIDFCLEINNKKEN